MVQELNQFKKNVLIKGTVFIEQIQNLEQIAGGYNPLV